MIVTREPISAADEGPPSDQDVTAEGRRGVVLLLMAIALISHFNRVSISTAGDTRIMSPIPNDSFGNHPDR